MSANYITQSGRLRGGEHGNGKCGLIIGLIVAVVIIVILICVLLIPCCKSSSDPAPTSTVAARARLASKRRGGVRAGHAQAPQPAHAGAVHNPRAVGHHAPPAQSAQPAPLPQAQLMAATTMPPPPGSLEMVQSSSAIVGDYDQDGSSSMNAYADKSYTMDPGMMTTSSTTDIQGIDTFMPMMSGGVGGKDGPVDPSTGLPLFTTGKLTRSQLLGGHGAGSFLRQQQDPLSGYAKTVGRQLCGSQAARENIAARRTQFNAARLADPNGDPVLFNTSEFMYY